MGKILEKYIFTQNQTFANLLSVVLVQLQNSWFVEFIAVIDSASVVLVRDIAVTIFNL